MSLPPPPQPSFPPLPVHQPLALVTIIAHILGSAQFRLFNFMSLSSKWGGTCSLYPDSMKPILIARAKQTLYFTPSSEIHIEYLDQKEEKRLEISGSRHWLGRQGQITNDWLYNPTCTSFLWLYTCSCELIRNDDAARYFPSILPPTSRTDTCID